MPTHFKIHDSGVDKVFERQMRNWEIARSQRTTPPAAPGQQVEHFVTISRSVGLSGDDAARAIGQRLGWPVFDKEVLQEMAGDDDVRRRLYELMDGRDLSWLEACLQPFSVSGAERDDYFHRLTETILSLARKGHAVFLGRGADLILPRDLGLRVRVMASRRYCIEQYARAHDLTIKKAEKVVEDIERERYRYIRNHFHVDAAEPTRFDLIFNQEHLTTGEIADIVAAALRVRRIIV